jgi:putative transposase
VKLREDGFDVGRWHLATLMRRLGIEALHRKPRTSQPNRQHRIYPHLLKDVAIARPNQIWAADITSIPMARGFGYLMAIIDLFSRKVLAHRLSDTMTVDFCVSALQEALARFGTSEIFNTDQGAQFTDTDFTDTLAAHGVAISMDGKGRWIDNVFIGRLWRSVKYEDVCLRTYESLVEARRGLAAYFCLYNGARPHQGIEYRTPDAVHFTAGRRSKEGLRKLNSEHGFPSWPAGSSQATEPAGRGKPYTAVHHLISGSNCSKNRSHLSRCRRRRGPAIADSSGP